MAETGGSFEVAVIGLGAMGAAVLYQLAKSGIRAVGIDRFSPPHDRGSTHGETRITRQAIGEGEAYVPLVLRSHEIWQELQDQTGERLLVQNGCLIVGVPDDEDDDGVRAGFLKRTCSVAERNGIAHERLDAEEIRRRFPQFTPQDHEVGYFEPGGGYLNPEACVTAQLALAQSLGASMRLDTRVLAIEPSGSGVRIVTDRGTLAVGHAVVSAGSWAPALLGEPFDWILAPSRQVMHWFPVDQAHGAHWAAGPVFIWSHGLRQRDAFYGFPTLNGSPCIKTASEQYDVITLPDEVERSVATEESRSLYDQHLAGRLAGLKPAAAKAVTCLYTVTPDSNFLVDWHPAMERVLVVSPCSGHGFKHSAAIGEAAADIVTKGGSGIDLSAFRLSRFERTKPQREPALR